MEISEMTSYDRTLTAVQGFDRSAAVWAGLLSGLIMLLISIVLPWLFVGDPFLIVRLIASILLGPGVIPAQAGIVPGIYVVALITHFSLSIIFAFLIALIFYRWGIVVSLFGGAIMGAVVYFMNYYTFSLIFPWLFPYRNWMLLLAHIFFGALAGALFELFEDERFVDQPLIE
jgi:hypothetical protein